MWQFLRLAGSAATIDRRRYYLDNVAGILSVFQAIVTRSAVSQPAVMASAAAR